MTIIGPPTVSAPGIAPGAPALAPSLPSPSREITPGANKPFADMFDQAVSGVEAQQAEAAAITKEVLLGDNPNLHQSVIAMQEASLSFSLMVEVRNKVVQSYQELMRMPV